MTEKAIDPRLRAELDEALRLRDAGQSSQALQILRRLAAEAPDRPSILGVQAGMEYQAGNYEESEKSARVVVGLSPRSGLASMTLFLSLNKLGRVDEALAEMARFRAVAYYADYDKLLSETYDDTLRQLAVSPLDPNLRKIREALHAEKAARPIRH